MDRNDHDCWQQVKIGPGWSCKSLPLWTLFVKIILHVVCGLFHPWVTWGHVEQALHRAANPPTQPVSLGGFKRWKFEGVVTLSKPGQDFIIVKKWSLFDIIKSWQIKALFARNLTFTKPNDTESVWLTKLEGIVINWQAWEDSSVGWQAPLTLETVWIGLASSAETCTTETRTFLTFTKRK